LDWNKLAQKSIMQVCTAFGSETAASSLKRFSRECGKWDAEFAMRRKDASLDAETRR
jgi:hypothetical protein